MFIHTSRFFVFLPSLSLYCVSFKILRDDNISHDDNIDREPRTVIHVKRAKMFDPMG